MCDFKKIDVCMCVVSFSERAAGVLPFTVLPFRVDPDKAICNDLRIQ